MERKPSDREQPGDALSPVLERNIHTLMRRRIREERARAPHERWMDRAAAFLGSIHAIWFHALLFGAWMLVHLPNESWVDPGLMQLGVFASVEAIFIWTLVLIRQNRFAEEERRRNDLDLQISLLAEHEITRLMGIVAKIAEKVGVEDLQDEELDELMKDIGPERVLDRMEQSTDRSPSRNHRRT